MTKRTYGEIRADYYDEKEKKYHIDAWETEDDNEEGKVIAKVDNKGLVEYLDERAENDPYVQEVVAEALEELQNQN